MGSRHNFFRVKSKILIKGSFFEVVKK